MDPYTAAALWKQHIEPKRNQGYKLCSPAMSSRPNGQQWMAEFMKACDGCHVSYHSRFNAGLLLIVNLCL